MLTMQQDAPAVEDAPTSPSPEWSLFVRQERVLIVLNLTIIAALVAIHVGFSSVVGSLGLAAYLCFCIRFAMQAVEWSLIEQGVWPTTPRAAKVYGVCSVLFNILFAALLSICSEIASSHYAVLMLIGVVAAAFRLSPALLGLVTALASALAFVEVTIFYHRHPPLDPTEYFEAATISLVYITVAVVVRLLLTQLRDRQHQLEAAIAQLRTTQAELVRSERLAAVGELSSALAHEVRNPVAMIAASLRRVRQGNSSRSSEDLCAIAELEAGKLERLTSDFLSYAKPQRLNTRLVDLRDLAGAACDTAGSAAEEQGVAIVRTFAAQAVPIQADAPQLHRAILNLLRNATEASTPGDVVGVEVFLRGDDAVLAVENPGRAIPAAQLDRLFEPFSSHKPNGTGLGLAISHSACEAHGGSLRLAVNGPEVIRFEIAIPHVSDKDRSDAPDSDR